MQETKTRSLIKAFGWRVIAIGNSFAILISGTTDKAIWNALLMNLTGFILYFIYERVCNLISYGREELTSSESTK